MRGPECRDDHRYRVRTRDIELQVSHGVVITFVVHHFFVQKWHQHGKIFLHMLRRLRIGHAEHAFDDYLVRESYAERESIVRHRGRGERLLRDGRGVAWIGWDHGCAEFQR